MGKVCRGGYLIVWWKGDHEPRHVHVKTTRGQNLGRLDITTFRGIEGWTPAPKLVDIIQQLKREGRL